MREVSCRNCGRRIVFSGIWAHLWGDDDLLVRCDPAESRMPYGAEATP